MTKEPYRQFVYHFEHKNSINVHEITDDDLEYCLTLSKRTYSSSSYARDGETAREMMHEWFPEYMI